MTGRTWTAEDVLAEKPCGSPGSIAAGPYTRDRVEALFFTPRTTLDVLRGVGPLRRVPLADRFWLAGVDHTIPDELWSRLDYVCTCAAGTTSRENMYRCERRQLDKLIALLEEEP